MAITLEEIKKSYQEKAAGASTGNLQEIKNLYKQKKEEANAASSRSESMRTSLGRRPLGADQPVETASAKPAAEKPSLQQNQISGEIAARTAGAGSRDPIGTAEHALKINGLQVQEAELKMSQVQKRMEEVQKLGENLAASQKKLLAAEQGIQKLQEQYQLTGDEVTGNAYMIAMSEYQKMLKNYQTNLKNYEGKVGVFDEYNGAALKYQKAYAAYEKSMADYDEAIKPQREYEERLRHVQELRNNRSVDYLQEREQSLSAELEEMYRQREIMQGSMTSRVMTPEQAEMQKRIDDRISLLTYQQNDIANQLAMRETEDWMEQQKTDIEANGGDQLMQALMAAAGNPRRSQRLAETLYEQGYSEAQVRAWLDYAQMLDEQEAYQSALEGKKEYAKEHAVTASAASAPLNLASGIGAVSMWGQKAENLLFGKDTPLNYQNRLMVPGAVARELRSGVSEKIEESTAGKAGSNTAFGNLYSGAYNLGMSMADSLGTLGLTALGVPPAAASSLLGGAAATSGMVDALERGATQDQALLLGTISGIAEMFFEKYSIDNLINMKSPKTLAQALKNMAIQGGVEASEEGATTLANTAADLMFLGDRSELLTMKQEYIAQGYSEKEAGQKAALEWLAGLTEDLVGGFVSGGLFGAGDSTIGLVKNKAAAKKQQSTTGQVNTANTESTVAEKPADMKKTTPTNSVDVDYTEVNEGMQWAGNQNEGGTENVRTEQTGEPGVDGNIGRENGVGAGTGLNQSGEHGAAAIERGTESKNQIQSYVQDLRRNGQLEVTSQKDLGIADAADGSIEIIPERAYSPQIQNAALQAQDLGMTFTATAQPIIIQAGESTKQASGYHTSTGIVVQANNSNVDIETATQHEIYHELARRDPELVKRTMRALQTEYSQEELDAMYGRYEALYDDAYAGRAISEEALEEMIYQEMLADAYANRKRRGVEVDTGMLTEVTRREAAQVRDAATRENGNAKAYEETELEKRFKETAENDTYLRRLKRQYQNGEISKRKYDRLVRNHIDRTPELSEIETEDFDARVTKFSLEEDPYTYEALVGKPDMVVTMVEDRDIPAKRKTLDVNKIAEEARAKAETLHNEEYGDQKYVYIKDLSANVLTPKRGFVHGLKGNKTNSSAINTAEVTYDLTNILKNSIAVNEKNPRTPEDGEYSYILFGYAKRISDGQEYIVKSTINHFGINKSVVDSVEIYDVLKGSKAKKVEPASLGSHADFSAASLPDAQGSNAEPSDRGSHTGEPAASVLNSSGSTISVAELLETVKENYPELLPDNVREYFGIQDTPKESDMRYSVEENSGLQWAGNTQQQKKTTAQTGDSLTEEIRRSAGGIDSFIAAQPGRIIDRIDKVQKKVRHELHKSMGRPTDMPKDFRDTAPETIVKTYLEEGTIPQNVVNELFDMAYKNTDWGTGPEAEKNKTIARSDFQAAINQCMSHMQGIRRYLKEKQDLKTMDLSNVKPYKELWKTAKRAKRNYSVVMAKSLLTYSDQIQLGRLLRGEITLEALSSTYNVEEIREAYEAKREYEDAMIALRAFKRAVKAARMEQASDHIGDVNAWKDKSINILLTKGKKKIPELGIAYSVETMERNVRDIAPTPEIAERIISTYFTPVHVNEAKATRLKNRLRKQVADLNLSREAPEGKMSESAAVQFVGEAMDYIQQLKHKPKGERLAGMTLEEWESELDQMWQDNPELNRAKIENAVKVFRRIYDQLFEMMNEVRIRNGYEPINYRRGYFPHFQEMEADTLLSRFSKALGADSEITALPTAIAGRTKDFKPGIRWTGFANERHGTDTVVDAVQGFDSYIEGAADVIYHTDDIQNIRALASAIRYAGSESSVQDQVDKIRRDENLSVEEKEQKIKEIYEKTPYKLSNFVQELDEYANLLANKRSKYDREMESAIGRGIYNVLKAAQSRVGANMVAINPGSWLTNLIPISQGWPSLDTGILVRAMLDTIAHRQDGVVENSTFLTNRRGSERLVIDRRQQITNKLSKPMEWIDQFTSDSLVRARYRQNLEQGLSETAAMEEADAWAASLIADRSKGAMPTLYAATNPLIKAFTQFQLEQKNQFSYWFKDVPKEMREKGIKFALMWVFKALLGTYMINGLFEALFGRSPAFEPLALLNEEVGNITGYSLKSPRGMVQALMEGEPIYNKQKQEDLPTAVENIWKTGIEQVPFIGGFVGGGRLPISSALPDFGNLKDAAFTEAYDPETNKGMTWQERLDTAWKEISKPLFYMIMPYGGGQAKKVVENTRAVLQRGSYSTSQNLQYPVFADDPWDAALSWAGGTIFGKSSMPPAREWVDSGFQGLNEKYTSAYREMIDMGEGDRASWELLQAMRDAEVPEGENRSSRLDAERRRILRESSVSGEAKYMVYHDLLATDTERKRMDALEGADPETVFNLFTEMKEQDDNGDKLAILRSALTEQEKAILFDAVKEKENARLQAATKYVDSFLYADFLEAYKEKYPDEKKLPKEGEPGYKTKSERVQLILNSIDATKEEKAAVWQIFVNGEEGKSNPFSAKIGKEIWDTIQKLYDQIEEDGGLDWAGRY